MQLHVFSYEQTSDFSRIFDGFLSLRKRKLVDELGWTLACRGEVERDQYDRPGTLYSIATYNGEVVAGARAQSCGNKSGRWTYMLKDAADGKLVGIPGGLLVSYPSDNTVWECTRFVNDERLFKDLPDWIGTKLVVAGLCQATRRLGAERLISLSPRALGVLLRRFGYQVQRQGRRYLCEDDQREYWAFVMGCAPVVNEALFFRHATPPTLEHAHARLLSGVA
ncbi:acyl-homoserine-lactone synthase [Phaeobacter sp. JH18-32]|uniref:acyl-homoserine-lactone synthase n=1 Tax=Phaeobacter TaxID=302485 RepID=UPI003A8868A8